MKIETKISRKRLLWQILFLCLPAVVMVYILLRTVADYFPVINAHQHLLQTAYFSVGILLSCTFYSYRFKFWPSTLIILTLFGLANMVLDSFAFGEFDSFFLSVKFLIFRILFIFSWICGWGFSRSRYFSAFLASLLLLLGVSLMAYIGNVQFKYLVLSFGPIIVYSFYNIYMCELIRNTDEHQPKAWVRPLTGIIVFLVAMLAVLSFVFLVFKKDFRAMEDEWGGSNNSKDKHGMYQRESDSTFKLKNKISLHDHTKKTQNSSKGSGSKGGDGNEDDNEDAISQLPMFVAYLDNYFPSSKSSGGKVPNPLYFVTDYLTKFDDFTETFEPDKAMPFNDLFSPDPTSIPLYFGVYDSTVLTNGMSTMQRKVVEVEVYKIFSSPSEFTAPSTAFFCQPIAVRKELQDQFKSAYRAKMWVSNLNSAYFVYNNVKKDWKMQRFQENRFELLREVDNFDQLDSTFLAYYTTFAANPNYDTIRGLVAKLIEESGAEKPIDKILTVRDFFMSSKDDGKHLFEYVKEPGSVPSGSILLNFLLKEHKGDCAYFAGSTLFMLRACGIPSRIALGYAVVDRSSNNKGWYWVYGKQSHAWVQAFFPGYGWLDFDTTFGDSEREEAPGVDGTPPLDPQKAWFAGVGTVDDIDTLKNTVTFLLEKMMYHDLEYNLDVATSLSFDMSLAKIYKDSLTVKLSALKKGEKGTAISFSEPEEMPTFTSRQDIQIVLEYFPKLVPIDEFRVSTGKKDENKATDVNENEDIQSKGFSWRIFWYSILAIVILLIILMFSTPYIIYCVYKARAQRITNADKEAFYSYRAAMFLLHQMGYLQENLTPLQYARQKIDVEFGTSFEAFVATYLKAKYAGQPLKSDDYERIMAFYTPFDQVVKAKINRKKRILRFMNIYNTLDYFTANR